VGLYQRDVVRIIGVSNDTITNWEKGRTKPCGKNTRKIELFLEAPTPRRQDDADLACIESTEMSKSRGCRQQTGKILRAQFKVVRGFIIIIMS